MAGILPIVIGVLAITGGILDPGGYFTKGFERNPTPKWSAGVRTPEAYRFWMVVGGVFFVAIGITLVVLS
jgi:hypothetical protein